MVNVKAHQVCRLGELISKVMLEASLKMEGVDFSMLGARSITRNDNVVLADR